MIAASVMADGIVTSIDTKTGEKTNPLLIGVPTMQQFLAKTGGLTWSNGTLVVTNLSVTGTAVLPSPLYFGGIYTGNLYASNSIVLKGSTISNITQTVTTNATDIPSGAAVTCALALKANSDGSNLAPVPEKFIPSTIFGNTGAVVRVQFDNLLKYGKADDFLFNVISGIGKHRDWFWELESPVAGVNTNIQLLIHDKRTGVMVSSNSISLIVAPTNMPTAISNVVESAGTATAGTASTAVYGRGALYYVTNSFNTIRIPLLRKTAGQTYHHMDVFVGMLQKSQFNTNLNLDVSDINFALANIVSTGTVSLVNASDTLTNVYVTLNQTVTDSMITNADNTAVIGFTVWQDDTGTNWISGVGRNIATNPPMPNYAGVSFVAYNNTSTATTWKTDTAYISMAFEQSMVTSGSYTGSINCAVIGDSISAGTGGSNDALSQNLFERQLDDENFKMSFFGTKTSGTATNAAYHDAISGGSWDRFYNDYSVSGVTNGFISEAGGKFNLTYWSTNNSFPLPDAVIIALGVNDVFSSADTNEAISRFNSNTSNISSIISNIKSSASNCAVYLVCAPTCAADQNAAGDDYSSGQTSWQVKANNLTWNELLVSTYHNPQSKVYVIPNIGIDPRYDYPFEKVEVVYGTVTNSYFRQNNLLHPASAGHNRFADAVYSAVKYYTSNPNGN